VHQPLALDHGGNHKIQLSFNLTQEFEASSLPCGGGVLGELP